MTAAQRRGNFSCLSLRTQFFSDAKCLVRRLTAMSDRAFAADAQTMMASATGTQVRMLKCLARFGIEAFERVRAVPGPRIPAAAAI